MSLPPEAAEVTRLIDRGNSKSALELAKGLHKRLATPASEALLVEAYAARAKSMREHRLAAEADALLAMVREKFPRSASWLAALAAAGPPSIDEIVRPLADPVCPPETRAAVESTLRATLENPVDLANCAALAPAHPLRLAAAALAKAFNAVTSGPVEDAAIALPEISHRGPLGPWKPLLRAIAAFYRGEDEVCERNLAAMDSGSAPARLAPALRAMLAGAAGRDLNSAAAELVSRATGNLASLRDVLSTLEAEFHGGSKNSQLNGIRDAISLAQKECPDLLSELRRQIGVHAEIAGLSTSSITSALGGPPPDDARTALLHARLAETDEDGAVNACFAWETFRVSAIQERWFPPRGPEVATVYLHMAKLAAEISQKEIDDVVLRTHQTFRREFPEAGGLAESGMRFLEANWLYETACEMDPHAEAFQQWVTWAEQGPGVKTAETAALAWHETLPRDPRPLLRLMSYAEDRNALKKALDYLGRAEKLDGLNPEVRNARLRLMVRETVRHLKALRLRQAFKSIAALRTLPQVREKDRLAFVDAIDYVAAMLDRNREGAALTARRMDARLGSERAGVFARTAAASLCKYPGIVTLEEMEGATGDFIESIARVTAMGRDLDFTFGPPPVWRPALLKALHEPGAASAAALEEVGRIALRLQWYEEAFAATAAGLRNHPGSEARFLLLRARVLPDGNFERCEECTLAALELARRQRDLATTNEAVEGLQALTLGGMLGLDDVHLNEKQLKKVLDRERNQRKLPREKDSLEDMFNFNFDAFLPPKRRRRRR